MPIAIEVKVDEGSKHSIEGDNDMEWALGEADAEEDDEATLEEDEVCRAIQKSSLGNVVHVHYTGYAGNQRVKARITV